MEANNDIKPIRRKKIQIQYVPKSLTAKEGVVSQDLTFKWQTNDTIKPFEKGLPLTVDSPISKPFVDILEVDLLIKRRREEIIDEFYPPEMKEIIQEYEAEETVNPQTQSQKFTKLYNKINNKKLRKANRPKTGIVHVPLQRDAIDCIGPINLRSVKGKIPAEEGENPFPPIPRRTPKIQMPAKNLSNVVSDNMHRVFRSHTEPFTDIDREEDFPMDGFFPKNITKDDNDTDYSDSEDDDDDEPHKSLLIDPHERDIFWTKDKVPFTRAEVEMFKKWRQQNRDSKSLQFSKDARLLEERAMEIERTFQSRLAFDKKLALTDKLLERVKYLAPGKGESRSHSAWKVAAAAADRDPSSLPYRKAVWSLFQQQVAFSGYLKIPTEEKLVGEIRRLFVSGAAVNSKTFFRALDSLRPMEFARLSTSVIIEHLRRDFGVTQAELIQYLKFRKAPDFFIIEAPEEIERIGKRAQRAERAAKEEAYRAKLRTGTTPVPDLALGMPMFAHEKS